MSGKKETKQIAAGPHFSSMESYTTQNTTSVNGLGYHQKSILRETVTDVSSTGPVSSVTSAGPALASSCSRAKDSMADADLAPS